MHEYLIDVCLPTYKPNPDHLRAAIDSLFAQTEQRWHLWIQDEPTEVNTKELVSDYLEDERVNFCQNSERLGIGKNWNASLKNGNAPYIQFLFQDDLWNPNYLSEGLNILEHNSDVGFVSLGHEYLFEGSSTPHPIYKELADIMQSMPGGKQYGTEFLLKWMENGLRPNVIGEPCFVMLRRDTIEEVGPFHCSMQQFLDAEYWTRMLAKTNWYYKPGNYGSFRVHEQATTARNKKSGVGKFDRFIVLKNAVDLLPPEQQKAGKRILRRYMLSMMKRFFTRTP